MASLPRLIERVAAGNDLFEKEVEKEEVGWMEERGGRGILDG